MRGTRTTKLNCSLCDHEKYSWRALADEVYYVFGICGEKAASVPRFLNWRRYNGI